MLHEAGSPELGHSGRRADSRYGVAMLAPWGSGSPCSHAACETVLGLATPPRQASWEGGVARWRQHPRRCHGVRLACMAAYANKGLVRTAFSLANRTANGNGPSPAYAHVEIMQGGSVGYRECELRRRTTGQLWALFGCSTAVGRSAHSLAVPALMLSQSPCSKGMYPCAPGGSQRTWSEADAASFVPLKPGSTPSSLSGALFCLLL
jgi:hypothetical protein